MTSMPKRYIPVVEKSDYLQNPYAVLDPITKKFVPKTPMPTSKVCPFCQSIFRRRPKQAATHWRSQCYCSKNCASKALRTRLTIQCETCKKDYSVQPYRLLQNKLQFCSMKCRNQHPHFKHLTVLIKDLSREHLKGERNWNWKGGITPLINKIRKLEQYKTWTLEVFRRDQFSCQDCQDKTGGNLVAHHLTSFSYLIQQNSITTVERAQECEVLWEIENGVTLCRKCHENTSNFGFKAMLNPIDRRVYR